MNPRIGIMQGRLSKPLNGEIQSFPKDSWESEFYLAKDMNVSKIIGADISQKNINKAQENLEIYNSPILKCDFYSTSFYNIKMVDSACYSSEFNGCSFSYLNLDECCFYTTVFKNCSFKKNSYSSDRIKRLFNENIFINCTIDNNL